MHAKQCDRLNQTTLFRPPDCCQSSIESCHSFVTCRHLPQCMTSTTPQSTYVWTSEWRGRGRPQTLPTQGCRPKGQPASFPTGQQMLPNDPNKAKKFNPQLPKRCQDSSRNRKRNKCRKTFVKNGLNQWWENIFYGGSRWRFYCYRGPHARITHITSIIALKP